MNKLLTIALCCCFPLATFAQDTTVFSDAVLDAYAAGVAQNDAGDYLKAYKTLSNVEKSIQHGLESRHVEAANLKDDDFNGLYFPAKKSLAEVAYKLGNHVVAKRISDELRIALQAHQFEDDEDNAIRNGFLGDIAKIDADRFYLIEKFDSAEISLKAALAYKPYDSEGEDFKSKVLADLAQLYYKKEDYAKALAFLDSVLACAYYDRNGHYWTRQKTDEVNEIRSQQALCLARMGRYTEALQKIEPIAAYYKRQGTKGMRTYAEALRKKAKILMLQYDATGKYDPLAKTYYQEYLQITKRFVDNNFINMSESEREQYWMAEQPFVTDCYRLEGHAPELLYDVALFGKAILLQMGRDFSPSMTQQQRSRTLASMRVTWQQVQKAMPASSSAIEFIAYEKGGKNYLGALVLGKTGRPKFVSIFNKDSMMNIRLSTGYMVSDAFTQTAPLTINSLYEENSIRSLFWNNGLVSLIGKSKNVFFSPDGIIHQIGIEYLTPDTLAGKKFYRLTSTRLLTSPHQKTRTGSMLLSGYIDYHSQGSSTDHVDNDGTAYSLMQSLHMDLSTLDNSRSELDSIISARASHPQDTVVMWDKATEYVVRQLMQKYHVVLLSTHGEFTDATTAGTDIRPALSDTQLSKSCLFFAGAVTNMNDRRFDPSSPDGILSARELAGMNLSGVDLAVLSACMTGLGYITPDGVYGLQRGLKAAGVKAVIASLWPVDDKATSVLMINLFRNMENGMSLYDAFNNARESVRNNVTIIPGKRRVYRRKLMKEPYFYDAFILIDGQE